MSVLPRPEQPAPSAPAPVTGETAVDEALAALADLDSTPLAEHHDQLAGAHEKLHRALNRDGLDAR